MNSWVKTPFFALLRYRERIEAVWAARLASIPECRQTIARSLASGTVLPAGLLAVEAVARQLSGTRRVAAEAGLRQAARARAAAAYLERRFVAVAERRRVRGEARELDERNRMQGSRS
ncbi:MAG TPA: hypothetical protein VKG44_02810 [Candidatus Baltobacteraceae bacterium]|nr:hypothetical protein [Candidatus Baltobacteraceae bacterium]